MCTIILVTFILIVILCGLIYWLLTPPKLTIELNGFEYDVDPNDPERSAKLMAKINETSIKVIALLRRTKERYEAKKEHMEPSTYVLVNDMYETIRKNYNPDGLKESILHPLDKYTTSYTIDKGEELCMCLKNKHGYHKWAVILIVLLHELTHMCCNTWSLNEHNEEFWSKYDIMLTLVSREGWIKKSDIPKGPIEYCDRVTITPHEFNHFTVTKPSQEVVA